MRPLISLLAACSMALGIVAASGLGAVTAATAAPIELPPVGQPAVVELFTSQGCSSCPPADRLLSTMGKATTLKGRVILLAYHVDYWDRQGWRDPFSSPAWSQRQEDYSREFGLGGTYTPQVVVNGAGQCVGSDPHGVLSNIAQAEHPLAKVNLVVAPLVPGDDTLRVKLNAKALNALPGDSDVMVALYESGLFTTVQGGENRGATSTDDFVVRDLQRALGLPRKAGSTSAGEISFAIQPGWNRAELGVAVFVQDPATLHILGAAQELPATDPARAR